MRYWESDPDWPPVAIVRDRRYYQNRVEWLTDEKIGELIPRLFIFEKTAENQPWEWLPYTVHNNIIVTISPICRCDDAAYLITVTGL